MARAENVPRTVTGVVFDLDGTLVDSAPGIERCVAEALDRVAPGASRPRYPRIGPPVPDMIASALGTADRSVIDAGVAVFRRCYDGGGWRETTPYEGAGETLEALGSMGIRLFLVTNKPTVPTTRILAELGWEVRFDAVLCRDSVQPPFPDKAAAVRDLVRRESLDMSRTLLVGDTEEDARSATANGLPFVFAAYGYGDSQVSEAARAAIGAPADLVPLLGRPGS